MTAATVWCTCTVAHATLTERVNTIENGHHMHRTYEICERCNKIVSKAERQGKIAHAIVLKGNKD